MEKKETRVAIKQGYNIAKISDMTAMANVLKSHVVKQKLYTNIKGKNYAHVEGWTYAGGLMGIFPVVDSVQDVSKSGEIKWQAKVNLVDKTGKVVGAGFAICSSKEANKKGFDEYAILSMAQTRAIGKAYRNLIGWVMKLAGYEGTPSEEMRKVGEVVREPIDADIVASAKAGPDGEKVLTCTGCDAIVTPQEAQYSKRIYKKVLCRDCQKGHKK